MATENFDMYTDRGNAAVALIVQEARNEMRSIGPSHYEIGWSYAKRHLGYLAKQPGFTEANDTAVREAVFRALTTVKAPPGNMVLTIEVAIVLDLPEPEVLAMTEASAKLAVRTLLDDATEEQRGWHSVTKGYVIRLVAGHVEDLR